MMDPRLRRAAADAAPRILAAYLHSDAKQFDRELRRLENRCGYLVARRALDAGVHSPEALKHALASAAPGFARAAVSGRSKDVTGAALHFVETLLAEGVKHSAASQLRRVPVDAAVKEALVDASPGLLLAAAKQDGHLGRNVAAGLAADLVRSQVDKHVDRNAEGLGGGMRNAALQAAPQAAYAAVRGSKDAAASAVLEFVGRAGVVSVDQIANRFVRDNATDLFADHRSAKGFLKELVLREWLTKREFVVPAAKSLPGIVSAAAIPHPGAAFAAGMLASRPVLQQAWTHVVYTTPRAAQQFGVPLPPDLRRAFLPHYLRTMDACLHVEQRLEAQGYRVKAITAENQLIRENFKGQVFKKGRVMPKFPDAQLTVRAPDGAESVVNVEYVTKSYTQQMIASKVSAFRGPTVWAVDSHATAAKVLAVAGADADLLLV